MLPINKLVNTSLARFSDDFRKLLVTREFGREGQLYHPSALSQERMLIEQKLKGISSESELSSSTLQISTYGIGGHMSPHYDTYRFLLVIEFEVCCTINLKYVVQQKYA